MSDQLPELIRIMCESSKDLKSTDEQRRAMEHNRKMDNNNNLSYSDSDDDDEDEDDRGIQVDLRDVETILSDPNLTTIGQNEN